MIKKSLFMIITGLLIMTACNNGTRPSNPAENATPVPVPPEYAGLTNPLGADAVSQGAHVFHTNCETCHGPQGYGDGLAGQALDPKPRNLAQLQTMAGDDFLFWRIREGKPGTSMVAWKGILTDTQIWQAISFIRTLK